MHVRVSGGRGGKRDVGRVKGRDGVRERESVCRGEKEDKRHR